MNRRPMEINHVDKGKDNKGFYNKYEMAKRDAGGRDYSEAAIRKAIKDFMEPTPVTIIKREKLGYFEAYVPINKSYRFIFCPVLE
jgi:hypothetical protein